MKKINHKLANKIPVLAAIIFAVVGLLATQVTTFGLSTIIHRFLPVFPEQTNPIVVVAVAFLALFLYKLWFRPEYTGSVVYSEYKKVWVLLAAYALFFAYGVTELVISHEPYKLTFNGFCMALFAGTLEEVVFRGYMIPVMMRKKKSIAVALFVSSGVFGLVHGANGLAGAGFGITVLQVFTSFALGIVLGGMYLLSGNLLIPIAIHTIHDILAIGMQGAVTETGVMKTTVTAATLLAQIPLVILLTVTLLFIFNKKNMETIYSVWEKKWKLSEE